MSRGGGVRKIFVNVTVQVILAPSILGVRRPVVYQLKALTELKGMMLCRFDKTGFLKMYGQLCSNSCSSHVTPSISGVRRRPVVHQLKALTEL
jgi:hypothetical protein